MGVKVLAASADEEAGARKMVAEHSLSFPVAYGVQPDHIEALGAFTQDRQGVSIIQPTEFVLNPDGELFASMYSTTQLGRMSPREVLQFIKSRM